MMPDRLPDVTWRSSPRSPSTRASRPRGTPPRSALRVGRGRLPQAAARILRAAVAGGVIGAGLLMTGCSSAPAVDPAATKEACTLLADADNAVNSATYQCAQDGKPAGGSDAARYANAQRGPAATEAFNAAPASLATVFSDAKQAAILSAAIPNQDSATAALWAIGNALKARACGPVCPSRPWTTRPARPVSSPCR